MADYWREKLDPARHVDWMSTTFIGGMPRAETADPPVPAYSYFVKACGAKLEFASLEQLRLAVEWFAKPLPGSSIQSGIVHEHYWQRWFERLPKGLTAEPKRTKVLAALQAALHEFERGT